MSIDTDQLVESLIQEYLTRKGFDNTLEAFIKERKSNGDSLNGLLLDDLVKDRLAYDTKYNREIQEDDIQPVNDVIDHPDLYHSWKEEDNVPKSWENLNVNNSLVIHLSSGKFKIKGELKDVLFVSLSNKELLLIDLETRDEIVRLKDLHEGVLSKLNYGVPGTDLLLSCDMNGVLRLFRINDDFEAVIQSKLKIHKRLVIDFKLFYDSIKDEYLIFSIGWDFYVNLNKLVKKDDTYEFQSLKTDGESEGIKLMTVPNSIEVGTFNHEYPLLFLTRTDSTRLLVYTVKDSKLIEMVRVALNDSQFTSNEFGAMSISLSGTSFTDNEDNKTLIGVTTSHIPYLRVLIVKPAKFQPIFDKLFKNTDEEFKSVDLYDQIVGNFNTLSPQDKYSQPSLHWTLDDHGGPAGCWIPGDDGIIRGLKFKDGKIFQLIGVVSGDVEISYKDTEEENVHQQRIKCFISHKGKLVSSGIDKKLIVWS